MAPTWMDYCEQADILRRELLEHYFTRSPTRPNAVNRRNAPNQQAPSSEGDRGSLLLSRADMTLHEVQVSLALCPFFWFPILLFSLLVFQIWYDYICCVIL